MNKPVLIEPEAVADLNEARSWYEQQRPGLGDDFEMCLEAAIASIAERPASFPTVHEGARRAIVHRFPYLVLFV